MSGIHPGVSGVFDVARVSEYSVIKKKFRLFVLALRLSRESGVLGPLGHDQGHLVHRHPRPQPSSIASPNDASPSLQETSLSRAIFRLAIRRRRRRSEQVHLLPLHRCSPRPMDIQDPPPVLPSTPDSRLACVQTSPRNPNPCFQESALDQGPS